MNVKLRNRIAGQCDRLVKLQFNLPGKILPSEVAIIYEFKEKIISP